MGTGTNTNLDALEILKNSPITTWEDGEILYADDLNDAFTFLHNSIPIVLTQANYNELKRQNKIEKDRIYLIAEEYSETEYENMYTKV